VFSDNEFTFWLCKKIKKCNTRNKSSLNYSKTNSTYNRENNDENVDHLDVKYLLLSIKYYHQFSYVCHDGDSLPHFSFPFIFEFYLKSTVRLSTLHVEHSPLERTFWMVQTLRNVNKLFSLEDNLKPSVQSQNFERSL